MEYHVRVNALSSALVVSAVVGVSVITSVVVASRAYKEKAAEVRESGQTIAVRGSARQRITSDLAVWRIRVTGENASLPEAYAELDKSVDKVREFIAKSGIKDASVELSSIDTSTYYTRDKNGNSTREVAGHVLNRDFFVTTTDVRGVADASGKVTDLIKDGVRVTPSPPEFTYSKLADMRVTILGEASKDAKVRADEVARHAGSEIGAVRSANMGPLQVVRPNSTEVSGMGMYDLSSIEKDVYAVVNMVFEIRKAQ
ncbi:MAG: SIMPL domain-containing protein [Phycisphaerales bacterium]|jgi:hypothetical protein